MTPLLTVERGRRKEHFEMITLKSERDVVFFTLVSSAQVSRRRRTLITVSSVTLQQPTAQV